MSDEELKRFMEYFKDNYARPRTLSTKGNMVNEMVSVNCNEE